MEAAASANLILFSQFLFFFFFFMVALFQGLLVDINVEATAGWLDAHATFYGNNQDPTSLGKNFTS